MAASKSTARLAGLAYLVSGLATLPGFGCAPLVQMDVEDLARLVAGSEARFRLGVASDLLAGVTGVFLVMLLYVLFERVQKHLAALMATLLLVSAPMSFAISLCDVAAHVLLTGGVSTSTFTQPQLEALARLFLRLHVEGVFATELLWGLWLLPFGLLVHRSGFLPRILGVFLVIGGAAYATHSVISMLIPGPLPAAYQVATMVGRGIGELPIILWLLIRGADIPPPVPSR